MSGSSLGLPVLVTVLGVTAACAGDEVSGPAAMALGESSSDAGTADVDGLPPDLDDDGSTGVVDDGDDLGSSSHGDDDADADSDDSATTGDAGDTDGSTSDAGSTGDTDGGWGSSSDTAGDSGSSSDSDAGAGSDSDGGAGSDTDGGAGSDSDGGSGSDTDGGSGSDTDGGSGESTGDTAGESAGESTGGDDIGFPTPEPFGDHVVELDLVGTWRVPTDPSAPGYELSLSIDAAGKFEWIEYDDACVTIREGTGVLWVNGAALVMLFQSFTDTAPWDVQSRFGWDAQAPFLIRAGYAPVLGHIAITAPAAMRIAAPWGSLGYTRTVGGTTAEDVWVAESELWAIPPGKSQAELVARDRHELAIADGDAWHVIYHLWFEDGEQIADPTEYYLESYSDGGLGYVTVDGEDYVYVGSSMASWEPGDNFQKNAPGACD